MPSLLQLVLQAVNLLTTLFGLRRSGLPRLLRLFELALTPLDVGVGLLCRRTGTPEVTQPLLILTVGFAFWAGAERAGAV
ncbi:hypothetical protein [Streptomyces sp. WAC01280]|uniref:hypothetical protein n=1 Tax=Streptomyces sp. WAC01280 TaxID=2487424 RepID=UPI000F798AEB|nr:hypothetical protein [Streptomyces sp. WAC01280]RSS57513.1 hypothetical protein EF909_16395 [Streptomyces sp. WAC01280]